MNVNKKIKAAALMLIIVSILSSLAGCSSSGDGGKTTETAAVSADSPVTDGVVDELAIHEGIDAPELYQLQWSGSELTRPDGSKCSWDWEKVSANHINKLNVHYKCVDESGKKLVGLPDTESFAALAEKMKYELGKSKEAGIDIVGFSTTVSFSPELAEKMGYTMDELAVVKGDGKNVKDTVWENGAYVACINSPKWRTWQAQIAKITAEAGFAELQFDWHPYDAGSFFCHCESCKASWKDYSKETLGEETPLLKTGFDFSKKEHREFFRWRMKCTKEFADAVYEATRPVNPEFELLLNGNVNSYKFGFECLYNCFGEVTTELHGVKNGYDSTLYMYQLSEAMGYNRLYAIYNNAKEQALPEFKAKTNYAEAYATSGKLGQTPVTSPYSDRLFDFINKYRKIYTDTHSVATAAVLYSAESSIFSVPKGEVDIIGQLFTATNDYARQAANALIECGVAYDYYAVENKESLDKLSQYGLLVVPSYSYFEDENWKGVIEKAVANGTKIVVAGNTAYQHIKALSDSENIIEAPEFRSTGVISSVFKDAVNSTAGIFLKLDGNEKFTAATIRTNDENYAYIHLIRRGDSDMIPVKSQGFTYKVPEGKSVREVFAYAPYHEDAKIDCRWSEDGGILTAKTGDFDTYAVIMVVLK